MSVDIATLLDIREAIERALAFGAGLDFDRFVGDERTMWAIYSQVVIIGEAAKRISPDFRQRHPDVPWAKMIAMRHRLVHGYDEIKWEMVWETVVEDLPVLKVAIAPLIPEET